MTVPPSLFVSVSQSALGGEMGLGSPGAASPTKPAGHYYQHYGSNPRRRALPMDAMGETLKTHPPKPLQSQLDQVQLPGPNKTCNRIIKRFKFVLLIPRVRSPRAGLRGSLLERTGGNTSLSVSFIQITDPYKVKLQISAICVCIKYSLVLNEI